MVNCAIKNCKNYSSKKIKSVAVKYFQFPKNEHSKVWITACGRNDNINVNHARICSDHFNDDDYLLRDQFLNTQIKKLKRQDKRSSEDISSAIAL